MLAAVHDGDTIRMVGTFGFTRVVGRTFTKVVTLDASRALFNDTLNLTRDTNLRVYGGTFNVTGGSAYNHAVVVYGGSNIAFDRSHVIGVGSQDGITFEGTTHATVTNGLFDGLHDAVYFGGVNYGSASRNTITHAEADGIDIGDSHFVTASYNSCSSGAPGAGVHPDCIQLWSIAGRPVQSDITVTHNTATGLTQGFTSFGSGGGALRVTITNNTVSSSLPQGVACYSCVDSNISYNTVSTLPGAQYLTNINIVGGSNNYVKHNVINPRPVAQTAFRAVAADGVALGVSGLDSNVGGVPEPTSWLMLVTGFAAVGLVARRGARGGATGAVAA